MRAAAVQNPCTSHRERHPLELRRAPVERDRVCAPRRQPRLRQNRVRELGPATCPHQRASNPIRILDRQLSSVEQACHECGDGCVIRIEETPQHPHRLDERNLADEAGFGRSQRADYPFRDRGLQGIVQRRVANEHARVETDHSRANLSVAAPVIPSSISAIVTAVPARWNMPRMLVTEPPATTNCHVPSDPGTNCTRVPASMPRRSRTSTGIVTWPLLVTVAVGMTREYSLPAVRRILATPELGLWRQHARHHTGHVSDLRQRVPGHSLIDMLLHQWDIGTIRLDSSSHDVVVGEDAVSWYRGVIGERRVGDILALLNDSHTVLHSVPVGRGSSDIDHVVIGLAGVFTINAKYSPGKKIWSAGYGMYVDGHKQLYVRNSVGEARRAAALLSAASGLTVPVTALIVFVDPEVITHRAPAGGGPDDPEVRVVSDADLLRVFTDRRVFSEEQVARIAATAVIPETWHRSPAESTLGHHITREFEALEHAVGPHLARAHVSLRQNHVPSRPNSTSGTRRPSTRTASRPPASRRARSRKRQSPLERLFTAVALPAAALIGLWAYMNVLTGK